MSRKVTDERAVERRDGTLYEIVDLGRDRDALPVAEVAFVHGAAARAHLRLGLGLVLGLGLGLVLVLGLGQGLASRAHVKLLALLQRRELR